MTPIDIRVVDDPAAEVAALLVDVACAGGHVALSGGSSPTRAYELAAETDADLSAATLWLGDERVVPHDDERSNLRMVRAALCDRLPDERRPRLMPVDTALGHDAAAAAYESLLRETLGNHPRLDLALMGLGPDGHTASLVPGDPALEVTDRLVALTGSYQGRRRMTLTYPALDAARRILWLVTGDDEREALAKLRAGDRSIPGGRVERERAVLLADAAAAPE
jgi:6-phosphogluconolactonase